VTKEELSAEVKKAQDFQPRLSEFFLLTTAPRDQKLQELTRKITDELAHTSSPMKVYIWGWDDIEEHAGDYTKAWKSFDPTYNPYVQSGFESIDVQLQGIKESLYAIQSGKVIQSVAPEHPDLDKSEKTPLHGKITMLQDLIDEGHADIAVDRLLSLKDKEWDTALESERYRLLVCIASAKIKLGQSVAAGHLLFDAYNESPEHVGAAQNQATGLLLVNDYISAREKAFEILKEDNTNSYAAGIIIQARAFDESCDNPLEGIPEPLYENENVLIALIYFQRKKGYSEWAKTAKEALNKHPDNHIIKVLDAEAILDITIIRDMDVLAGGTLHCINYGALNDAIETLYSEAVESLNKCSELAPSIIHNAALALRISDDNVRAKKILDPAIEKYPQEENLKLQRAIIAFSENDYDKMLDILPDNSANNEIVSLRICALVEKKKDGDALSQIDKIDNESLPEYIKLSLLESRIKLLIRDGNGRGAIELIDKYIALYPNSIEYKILKLYTYRVLGDKKGTINTFEETLPLVCDATDLPTRLRLSYEANKLNRDDMVVDLLKGRISTLHETKGLCLLITAAINSRRWATASEILESLSETLKNIRWFQKAQIILGLNTGDVNIVDKIDNYLQHYKNDLEILLNQITIYQRKGQEHEITKLLSTINLDNIEGLPEQCIRLAVLICFYSDVPNGLKYGYSFLMNNWDNPKVHLAYQSLMLLNEKKLSDAIPMVKKVEENTVVCLLTDGVETKYRIEKMNNSFFREEHVDPLSDLGRILIGKKISDQFKLQDFIGIKPSKVLWIKHVYIDAFHNSITYFNKIFPHADGIQSISIDPNKPLDELQEITKARSDTNSQILEQYRTSGIPLLFTAKLVGNDPIELMNGLKLSNYKLLVCSGLLQERETALNAISRNKKKGCILDAITLSLVRTLQIEDIVTSVCGPIYTTQSVIDLFINRAMEAKQDIGKKRGNLTWNGNHLVLTEYTDEITKQIAEEREDERLWAISTAKIIGAMPKLDFSKEVNTIIDMFGINSCDTAIAANGNNLLLLSEDMGFRTWSMLAFHTSVTWLQPVLMIALNNGDITIEKYCDIINQSVLNNRTYISLDLNCLLYQVRKDNYKPTNELSCLFAMLGGASADLYTNSGILGNFINSLCNECSDDFKIRKIVSEAYKEFVKDQQEDLKFVITLINKNVFIKREMIIRHALDWLIGHSIGTPNFSQLLNERRLIY
jgi:hypothetical protein